MKKISFFIFLFAIINLAGIAQEPLFVNQPPDSVVRQDSRMQKFGFEPGEILIRYKDEVSVSNFKAAGIIQTGINSLDQVFLKYKISESVRLFPNAQKLKSKVMLRGFNGQEFEKPSLDNIYKLSLPKEASLFEAIEELKQDSKVLYAEPNYILSITNDQAISPELSQDEMLNYLSTNLPLKVPPTTSQSSAPNDPLYPQQWYIPAVHADAVWDTITGDSTQIIAILDTGVDWLHPDLQNKIWSNPAEIAGNGIDDDVNGKIDDVRGWDWINNDQNPMDDNNHGTHVAGIAAAERNNGLGISGISQAKIMPLKAFTSAGYGNTADITQAINYAAANGATIINMSFGTYARSFVMENALLNAYTTCVLVASAGNDRESIYMSNASDDMASAYPAALSYVLGVEAESGFSNYDPDGPVFSLTEEGFNYELRAPGTGLLSTARNGTYVNMTGTSMAAPVVAGSIALYKAFHPNRSREEMWADLIYNSSYYVDIKESCVNDIKHPVLNLVEYHIIDTLAGGDGDGQADAGEQIQLWIKIKNTYGYADSVYALIRQTNTGDTTDVTIVSDSSYFGSISTFGSLTNEFMPFIIQINEGAGNNRNIELEVVMANHGDTANFTSIVSFRIYNGEELSGLLTQDKVLTPDKFWLINNSLRIGTGVTLTIMPGTSIEINAGVDNRGYVHAVGTPDSLINMFGIINGNTRLEYVNADLRGTSLSTSNIILNCEIYNVENIYTPKIIASYIHDVNGYPAISADSIISSVIENVFEFNGGGTTKAIYSQFKNVNLSSEGGFFSAHHCIFDDFMNIYAFLYPSWPSMWTNSYLFKVSNESANRYYKNTFFKNLQNAWFIYAEGGSDFVHFPGQYWGTTDSIKIKAKYFDFWNSAGLPFLITSPTLIAPSDSCPGHVWKILVNNLDAQDDIKEPLGVGVHKFEVYFNRAMNINYTPQLSFGKIFPYLQHTISDSASWSADHKIWTVFKKVELFSGDGINRLRVDNARDANGMKIPLEDDRFEFIIQAAGSSSIDFMATPGLGKIKLEWNNSGIEDLLGFNMYRFQHITDTTFTYPTLINSSLITDTAYVDFDILPNVRYYYYYKILKTDFAESDSSKVISAIPLTAQIGDANGDLSVNVLDITTLVSYLLNQDPKPFIFDAADVNNDNTVNILDIIGVVNIINGGGKKSLANLTDLPPAYIYLDKNEILFKTQHPVSALQFELVGNGIENIVLSSKQKGFELAYTLNNGKIIGIIYSFNNKQLPSSLSSLISISGDCSWLKWGDLLAGDPKGNPVKVIPDELHSFSLADFNLTVFPNPFNQSTTINYDLYEKAYVQLHVYDMYGRLVQTLISANQSEGNYKHTWKGTNSSGGNCKQGFYFCRLEGRSISGKTFSKVVKMIYVK